MCETRPLLRPPCPPLATYLMGSGQMWGEGRASLPRPTVNKINYGPNSEKIIEELVLITLDQVSRGYRLSTFLLFRAIHWQRVEDVI